MGSRHSLPCLPLCSSNQIPPLTMESIISPGRVTPLISVGSMTYKDQNVQMAGSFSNSMNHCRFSWCHHYPLGNKTSKLEELNVSETESKIFVSWLLGIILAGDTPTSAPWFPDLCVPIMGEKVPYNDLLFKENTASYKTNIVILG